MTDREAFRLGFYLRCAEEGLSPLEADRVAASPRVMEKAALLPLLGAGALATAAAVPALAPGIGMGAGLLGGAALALPPALGYAGGVLGAKAMDGSLFSTYDSEDPVIESAKKRELADEYRRLADRIKRTTRRRRLRAGEP
jgi:hypothetical protein